MKKYLFILPLAGALLMSATPVDKALKIRYVDFKKCIELSKVGMEEKANFDAMKKKMESTLEEKQKELNSMASKLNDPDYLDSLSPDAETELKRKARGLSQELAEMENQSYQILNQTNFKVIQKITEAVSAASKVVAKRDSIDMILNEESCFFEAESLDITDTIVKEMDKGFESTKTGT